ncbi:Negative elongation factor C/D, partial [Aphelenchoides avenae]
MDKESSDHAAPPNDMELLQNHCMELFSLPDYVMEPQVVQSMLAFFQAGGAPEKFVDLLSAHYQALAQTANLLGKWLSDLEMDNGKAKQVDDAQKIESCASVRECLETAISSMVSKVFSPDAADKIFDGEATEGIDWLPQLISHRPWRRMIYELADQYPQCLMLNFAVKLISDAGFQHEISNVNTATQQLEIFSRVFLSSIQQLLEVYGKGENTEVYEQAFTELVKVACHSEQTYLYTQAMLHLMAEKESGKISSMSAHVSQSLRLVFEGKEQESTALTLFIGMIQSESDSIPANCIQAMLTMVAKRSLNPADINQLYQAYFEPFPPPVGLIRDPLFFNMLIDALFNFTSPKVNAEHRPKYVYLLAYASSVGETTKNGIRVQSKNELDATRGKIDDLLNILKSSDDLLMCLSELLQLVKLPVAACALLHFLKTLIMRDEFLGEPLPVHHALLDQIATNHPNLHS